MLMDSKDGLLVHHETAAHYTIPVFYTCQVNGGNALAFPVNELVSVYP